MEDALYYQSELSAELLKKVQERDAKNRVQEDGRQLKGLKLLPDSAQLITHNP
jgi:hypothetical protein